MPDQTKTIISGGGGDYSTIQAWENDTDVSGGFWKGVITDNTAYDEAVTISGGTGTPSSSNYVWLTAASGNKHSGAAGTGHARIVVDTASGHALDLTTQHFTRISDLEIKQESPGTSDEGIRIDDANDVLVENCIIWTDSATADTDGFYHPSNNSNLTTIVNCLIYGWIRAGIHQQNISGGVTHPWSVEHCSIYDCAYGIRVDAASGSNITLDIDNTACLGNTSSDYSASDATADSNSTWNINNSADSDNSIASRLDTGANNQASLTATTVWTDPANGDFTVVNGQGLDDNGHSFTSGDARADVWVDIIGTSRNGTTPDIGCFEEGGATAYTLTAAGGSYAWTGTAANLEYHSVLAAAAGSYAWTGTAASLEYGSLLSAESGSYAWTGTAANLEYHAVLAAAAGSYAWAGQDATLTYLTGATLTAEAGSYAWTGTAAGLLANSVLQATAVSYLWAGSTVSLDYASASIWTATAKASTAWSEESGTSSTWSPTSKPSTTWTES